MSGPDRRGLRKPQGPQHNSDQDQEQEQEAQTEQEGPEREHQRAQNTLGNSALSDMLASRGKPSAGSVGDGGGGLAHREQGDDKEGVEFGGDDDPSGSSNVTIEQLTRSWNPSIKKKEDRPSFIEDMPSDDLPPEDDSWVALIRDLRSPDIPAVDLPDGLLQPSVPALTASLGPWAREASRWLEPSLEHRCLGHVLNHPPTCLQDLNGRVLFARARIAALANCALLDTTMLSGQVPLGTSAFLNFMLETASGAKRVNEARNRVLESEKQLPVARELLAELLPPGERRLEPSHLPPPAAKRLIALLTDLTGLESPRNLVPHLHIPDAVENHDDPLGLDSIIAEFTEGDSNALDQLYHSAVQGAERLAGACARTRVAYVGAALAMADACQHWSAGVPTATFMVIARSVDERVQSILQLLVDVARAAKRKEVPPPGLANGLKRAARQLELMHGQMLEALTRVVASVVPEVTGIPDLHGEVPDDPLHRSVMDGQAPVALSWLEQHPSGLSRTVAHALLRCSSAESPETLADPLMRAAEEADAANRPHLARALETIAGPCMLWGHDTTQAVMLARRHMQYGCSRRNGAVIACAALLAVEALRMEERHEEAATVRTDAGRWCWYLGTFGPLSLLARWTPGEG